VLWNQIKWHVLLENDEPLKDSCRFDIVPP
jgi:hypothetical protein